MNLAFSDAETATKFGLSIVISLLFKDGNA